MPRFAYPFINRHSGCFYLLAIMKNAAVTMGVQLSLEDPAFN